jgi:[acyl-carrier-protein] S-malonyltransferase
VNNVDAALASDPEALRDGLLRQIPGAVRWEAIMALLLKKGVTTFVELGPGKVLSGLAKRQAKEAGLEVTTMSISGPEDLAQLG